MNRTIAVIAIACCSVCARLAAAGEDEKVVPLTYNHKASNADVTFNVALHPGQPFQITVEDTCKPQFEYKLYGVQRAAAVHALAPSPTTLLESVKLDPVKYEARFGSYILEVVNSSPVRCVEFVDGEGRPKAVDPDAKDDREYNLKDGQVVDAAKGHWQEVALKDVKVVIAVEALEWEVGQDAAFTFVPGTMFKYVLDSSKKIVRDKPREEAGRINFATLTHAYPPDRPWGLAAGFGAVNNELEYYLGVSLGFGPRSHRVFNVATGIAFTTRTILPPGVNEGDVAEAAALNNLPTKHVGRAFLAITATFFKSPSASTDKPQAKPE